MGEVDYAEAGCEKENLAILKNRNKNRVNVRIGFRILNPAAAKITFCSSPRLPHG